MKTYDYATPDMERVYSLKGMEDVYPEEGFDIDQKSFEMYVLQSTGELPQDIHPPF